MNLSSSSLLKENQSNIQGIEFQQDTHLYKLPSDRN